eukprot:TRINITY_DN2382_c3_g1_i1.p1 TRINITY_DN2382_c3_g1~~TRINITY_DN2382_c3_g1_i1.p1  ORF type:complete len:1806 (+),score=340.57 TRINITY_DN2382_c3_g1_i1:112-5418(+)
MAAGGLPPPVPGSVTSPSLLEPSVGLTGSFHSNASPGPPDRSASRGSLSGSVSSRSGRRPRSTAFRYTSLQQYEQQGFLTKPNCVKEFVQHQGEGSAAAGLASMQGWRKTMEDAHCLVTVPDLGGGGLCCGIFDGHNGDAVAKLLGERLPAALAARGSGLDAAASPGKVANAMRCAFFDADAAAIAAYPSGGGCTAVAALLHPNRVVVAHCGDARAVLCTQMHSEHTAIPLSHDHKPRDPRERLRVEMAGATVTEEGRITVPGVTGGLAVARAFGDAAFKQLGGGPAETPVSAEADVCVAELGPADRFLILACDGIWDVLSNQAAVAFVARLLGEQDGPPTAEQLSEIAGALCDSCVAQGTPGRGTDNMTAAVVMLDTGDLREGTRSLWTTCPLLMADWKKLHDDGELPSSTELHSIDAPQGLCHSLDADSVSTILSAAASPAVAPEHRESSPMVAAPVDITPPQSALLPAPSEQSADFALSRTLPTSARHSGSRAEMDTAPAAPICGAVQIHWTPSGGSLAPELRQDSGRSGNSEGSAQGSPRGTSVVSAGASPRSVLRNSSSPAYPLASPCSRAGTRPTPATSISGYPRSPARPLATPGDSGGHTTPMSVELDTLDRGQLPAVRVDASVLVRSAAAERCGLLSPVMLSPINSVQSPRPANPLEAQAGATTSTIPRMSTTETAGQDYAAPERSDFIARLLVLFGLDGSDEWALGGAAALLPLLIVTVPVAAALAIVSGAGGAAASAAVYGVCALGCCLLLLWCRLAQKLPRAAVIICACCCGPALSALSDAATAAACDAWALAVPFVVAAQSCSDGPPAAAAAAGAALWALLRTLDEAQGQDAVLRDFPGAGGSAVARRQSAEWTAATAIARLFAVLGAGLVAAAARSVPEVPAAGVVREIALAAWRYDLAGCDSVVADCPDPDLRAACAEVVAVLRHLRSCMPDGIAQASGFSQRSFSVRQRQVNFDTPDFPRRTTCATASPLRSGSASPSGGGKGPNLRAASRRSSAAFSRKMSKVSIASSWREQSVASMRSSSVSDSALTDFMRQVAGWSEENWQRPRDATLLHAAVDTESEAVSDLTKAVSVFISGALVKAQHHMGTTVLLGACELVLGWNSHHTCPQHAELACKCALGLMGALPQCATGTHRDPTGGRLWYVMALAGGHVRTGVTGTPEQRVPVTAGAAIQQAAALAQLAPRLQARAVVAERVYERVRAQFAGRPVDAVCDGVTAHSALIVYELLGRRGDPRLPSREDHEDFVSGFVSLQQENYRQCREHMLAVARRRPQDHQAVRLLRLASYLSSKHDRQTFSNMRTQESGCSKGQEGGLRPSLRDANRRYRRVWVGWEDLEAQARASSQDEEVEEVMQLLMEQSRASCSTDSTTDTLGTDAFLVGPIARKTSMRHAAMLRRAIREAEAEANAEELAAWGIMPAAQQAPTNPQEKKIKSLPARFNDFKDRLWQRAERCLGKGAFGEVWMGMSSEGALVAIKSMHLPLLNTMKQEPVRKGGGSDSTASTAARRRAARRQQGQQGQQDLSPRVRQQQQLQQIEDLLREVELMQQLTHDNIVGYLASAITDGYIMIVMEYLSGGSLQSVLTEFGAGRLPQTSVQRYLRDIVNGLTFLHFHEIVHRDLKPHNVLLLIDGQCKLADFGASAQLSEMNASNQGVIGTPLYMAPEACRGTLSKASDIWAFGIIVCQMFSGDLPYAFTDDSPYNPQAFMYRLGHCDDFGPSLPDCVPFEARGMVEKCIQREPSLRPAAEDLKAEAFLLA